MHIVSQRTEIERPSDFDIAKRLIRDNLRENRGRYELWINGSWVPACIDDIMKRANRLLKGLGRPQFVGKQEWVA